MCAELDLTHSVDPFAKETVFFSKGIAYFRLHGCPPGKKRCYYKYADEDLKWLMQKLEALEAMGLKVYCLFNNTQMSDDAARLASSIRIDDLK